MDIMKKIESGIYDLHMKARAEGKVQAVAVTPKETPVSPPPAPETLNAKYSHLTPIASVNSVAQLSPAFKANLQTGDLILAFGLADSSSGGFAKIKECVEENKSIMTVIKRKGEDGHHIVLELTLTPTKWAGPGLLGCHLLPA
jgi:26S proteasome non-ATPase regulatory subunit 9